MDQIREKLWSIVVTSTMNANEVGIAPIDIYIKRLLACMYNALEFERVYINMQYAHCS